MASHADGKSGHKWPRVWTQSFSDTDALVTIFPDRVPKDTTASLKLAA